MQHPWHDLSFGENAPEVLQAVIEIPAQSKGKFELDKESGMLKMDRVLFSSMHYPANYGFVPKTLCEDKDPIDVLVLSQVEIPHMCLVEARIVGVMHMEDGGENDDKLIAVADDDPRFEQVNDLHDLPEHMLAELKNFFSDYKKLEGKEVSVGDLKGKAEAIEIVKASIAMYEKEYS